MTDGKVEAARIATGTGMLVVAGITLSDWLMIVSIVYFVLQTIVIVPIAIEKIQKFRDWLKKRREIKLMYPPLCADTCPPEQPGFFKRVVSRIRAFFGGEP